MGKGNAEGHRSKAWGQKGQVLSQPTCHPSSAVGLVRKVWLGKVAQMRPRRG